MNPEPESRDAFLARMQRECAAGYESARTHCLSQDWCPGLQRDYADLSRLERMARGIDSDVGDSIELAKLNECHCWGQP